MPNTLRTVLLCAAAAVPVAYSLLAQEGSGQVGSGGGEPEALSEKSALRSLQAVTAGAGPRVGVIGYCTDMTGQAGVSNPAGTLLADGRFGSVTAVNGAVVRPTAQALRNDYDCVVVMTDDRCGIPLPQSTADVAADAVAGFVGAGGGAVVSTFGFAYRPSGSIGLGNAIFGPGLSPFQQAPPPANASAGTVNIAGASTALLCERITEGVTGSVYTTFANNVTLSPGAQICVSYMNGRPLVAINEKGNVVGFNSFPNLQSEHAQPGYRRLFSNLVYRVCSQGKGLEAAVDIQPARCRNVWNMRSKGVLSVALIGGANFDVVKVDPASLRLEGVAPRRWSMIDIAARALGAGKGDCSAGCGVDVKDTAKRRDDDDDEEEDDDEDDEKAKRRGDGYQDLRLRFDSELLAAALRNRVQDKQCVKLKLTGKLKAEFGGASFTGEDSLLVRYRAAK